MAAIPGIKYDDGLPGVSANCFPVRGSVVRRDADDDGNVSFSTHHFLIPALASKFKMLC